jgi:hypothetical protein
VQATRSESTISRATCGFARNPNQIQSNASRKTEPFEVSFSQSEAFCALCVQCTLTNPLQVIGVDPNFDFDVAAADAPWMNALEDGVLSVHSRRSRTPVQPAAAQAPFHADHLNAMMVVPVRNRLEVGMTLLTEMGMLEVYGGDLCRFMLERYEGNIDRAVEGLTALGGPQ